MRPLLALLVLSLACEKTTVPPASSTTAPQTSTLAPPSATATTAPTATSGVSLVIVGPGAVEVRNGTDAPVKVSYNMAIEKEGTPPATMPVWNKQASSTMTMRLECFNPPPDDGCITVPAHGSYRPMPWRGWIGCTQCMSCRANVPAQAGRYKLVAFECGSGTRIESDLMTLVQDGRFANAP